MDLHPLNMIYRRSLWRPAVEKGGYQKTAEHRYAVAAADVYHFILDKMVDTHPGSEWFWQTDKYGTPAHKPIVEPWKCPYHNGRMCMELMRRNPDVNV